MSNNKIIESPIFLGDAIRSPASKSTLGKDPRIAACKWIEEAQENANFAGQVRIFDSGGPCKFVSFLVEKLRAA